MFLSDDDKISQFKNYAALFCKVTSNLSFQIHVVEWNYGIAENGNTQVPQNCT